jgi:hypothetical protein
MKMLCEFSGQPSQSDGKRKGIVLICLTLCLQSTELHMRYKFHPMNPNDCKSSCKFNYHTTTTAQVQLRWKVIVLLILMEFMIITVYKISFHIIQWKELVCWKYVFCWGSLDGICISCEVPSIADTTLDISEQYLFFCHQTEKNIL